MLQSELGALNALRCYGLSIGVVVDYTRILWCVDWCMG